MQLSGRDVQELRRHFNNMRLGLGIARYHTSLSAPEAGVIDVAHTSARTVAEWLDTWTEKDIVDTTPVLRQPADQRIAPTTPAGVQREDPATVRSGTAPQAEPL